MRLKEDTLYPGGRVNRGHSVSRWSVNREHSVPYPGVVLTEDTVYPD